MEIFQAIQGRRSVRKFKDHIPPADVIKELVFYASLAPNAMNRQDWQFTVISRKLIHKKIYDVLNTKWGETFNGNSGLDETVNAYKRNLSSFIHAPVIIIVDAKKPPKFMKQYFNGQAHKIAGSYASACMAVQNLLLAAYSKGLGACVYSGVVAAEKEIKKIIGISDKRELVCLITLGYPDEEPEMPPRKDISEIINFIE